MLKKTIEYKDFNGKDRTEDFYFNLTKAEISAKQLSTPGGLKEKLERIVETNSGKEIIEFFTEIVREAYGERSEDGRSFNKSPEKAQWFVNSAAYDVLFMQLVTDPNAAAEFMNGIIPKLD